ENCGRRGQSEQYPFHESPLPASRLTLPASRLPLPASRSPYRLAPLLHPPGVMAYQSTFDDPGRDTNAFYRRTLHVLSDARVPFLVGGSHALLNYTGIVRDTKDFDLFVRRNDLDAALEALREAGYHTEITFPHWLAKARQGND